MEQNKNNIDPVLMNPQYVQAQKIQQTSTQSEPQVRYNYDPQTGEYIGPAGMQPNRGMNNATAPTTEPISMKWFKFIIYFQLFASAFFTFCSALSYATGSNQGEYAEQIYEYYGIGLRICDISFAGINILLVGYIIFTRFALAKYKKYGPACYLGVWILNTIIPNLYIVMLEVITHDVIIDWPEIIKGVISCIVMLVVNYIYFKKRKHMFVY